MFDSKADKWMCVIALYVMAFIFGLKSGDSGFYPFAAAGALAFGLPVKRSAKMADSGRGNE